MWCKICVLLAFINNILSMSFSELNAPPKHFKYIFNSFEDISDSCSKDPQCPYRDMIGIKACWGYEHDCSPEISYPVKPICLGDHRGWVKTKAAQYDVFYTQADFGYVKANIDSLKVMCEASYPDDTSLECSEFLRFCRGRNLMMNFTGLVNRGDNLRYKMDILGPGQIGGHCMLHFERLMKYADHMSPLQSWAPELVNFAVTPLQPIPNSVCDVVIKKPTYIMKIDATVNMYHHFCDFFNLYASLHVNSTHPSTFSTDNHILIWETFTYDSLFKDAFKAFTKNPIWDLKTFRGKVVCFKNVVLPLLPRMIFGLYYNTPMMYGCEKSGLFHAFSEHIIHSLNIKLHPRKDDRVRVTLLSRTSTRSILNEKELVDALNKVQGYDVQRVVYDRTIPFTKQLEITHNSDVFIGMHGAGLTHLLFLPDWAAVFEVYNCEDPNCYKDLSRLRGLMYVTWEDEKKLVREDLGHPGPGAGAHAKFAHYSFDVKEFLRLVEICANHVRQQKEFIDFVKKTEDQKQKEEL